MYNSLKILIRNLYRNALYTWINIIGLAISLTAAIFILLWVQDEWNHDRFYTRNNDIYKLFSHRVYNGVDTYVDVLQTPLAYAINEEIPEVEIATIYGRWSRVKSFEYKDKKIFSTGYDYGMTDSCFFQIFDMEFIEGNPQNAFPDPYSIVVTDEFANVIFGEENPIGKVLKGDNEKNYHVTGVVKKSPQNSEFQFKVLMSFEQSDLRYDWGNSNYPIFLRLNSDVNLEEVEEKIAKIYELHTGYESSFILQSLAESRLYNPDGKETGIKNVRMFSIVAVVLLFIACINYVNLVTARSHRRLKEVGLRKVMGANRAQLFLQMMRETLFLLFVSIAASLILLYLFTPFYISVTGKQLVFSLLNKDILISYLTTIIFIILFAGVYPAILLSSFKPMEMIRAKGLNMKGRSSFRRVLIVLQFACSAAFILSTVIASSQFHFMQTKDLGYDKENIFTINLFSSLNAYRSSEAIKYEIAQQSGVMEVTSSQMNVMTAGNTSTFEWEGALKDATFPIVTLGVDRNFFTQLNVKFIKGEGYTGGLTDSTHVIINEEAAKKMGLENPIDVVVSVRGRGVYGRISGVVKDFHFEHMSEPIAPILLFLEKPSRQGVLYVKVVQDRVNEVITATEQIWKKFEPETSFSYSFMDDTFNQIYQNDIKSRNLFNVFAFIVVFVSCLGLFGLATYTAETRTKEIGIRKTLGASVSSIIIMLSKEFVVLVGIAVAVGIPIAYYFMEKMLQSYAYRISITWWMILAAILVVLAIVVLTVSTQALRAARSNPVKAIKID